MTPEQKQQKRNRNCAALSGFHPKINVVDVSSQSHRDLLKTANTVVDMRDILDDVESKYKRLMTFTPDLIAVQASNAERYQKFVTGACARE